jgi:histidinol dehydrogenase
MKDVHIVFVEQAGLETMGDAVETLAGAEGLDAHAASIRLRRGADR